MRIVNNLMILFLFFYSSIFSQTSFSLYVQPVAEMKSYQAASYNRFNVVQPDKISAQHHSFFNLSGQALVGSTLAVGFTILPLSAVIGNAWGGNSTSPLSTALGVLTISSYLFGAAVGVHWIASYENPNLSLWGTAGYSVIGGSVGAIIVTILAVNYTTIPTTGVVIAALTPVIGSMIYASFIADWSIDNQEMSFHKTNLSHKDLIEQTNIIKLELLRIKL